MSAQSFNPSSNCWNISIRTKVLDQTTNTASHALENKIKNICITRVYNILTLNEFLYFSKLDLKPKWKPTPFHWADSLSLWKAKQPAVHLEGLTHTFICLLVFHKSVQTSILGVLHQFVHKQSNKSWSNWPKTSNK